jgi:hypothetical protein
VFLTVIESLDRVLSIPANYVFWNLVVVEYAVIKSIVDSVNFKVRPPPTSVHLIGACLMGVYLTGVHLLACVS